MTWGQYAVVQRNEVATKQGGNLRIVTRSEKITCSLWQGVPRLFASAQACVMSQIQHEDGVCKKCIPLNEASVFQYFCKACEAGKKYSKIFLGISCVNSAA